MDKPNFQGNSRRHKADSKDGHSNPGFVGENIDLKKKGSSLGEDTESSDSIEPVYCTIPEKKQNTYENFDAVAGDSKSQHQALNTANGISSALYARINNSDRPDEITLTHTEV